MAKPARRNPAKPKAAVSNPLAKLLARSGVAPQIPATPKNPASPSAYADIQALLSAKELTQAQARVDALLSQSPKDPYALNLKAVIAAELRQPDVAEGIWRELLARNPHHVDARSNLGRLLQIAGRHDESIELLEQAVQQNPKHADAHMNLGVALDRVGRHDEALASYRRSLEIAPRNAQALFNIGKLLQDAHDFSAAHAHYRQALDVNPVHPGAFANLIFTQHYLPNYDPAANRDTARQLATTMALKEITTPSVQRMDQPRPLRVGLVSGDLRIHPVGYFLQNVLPYLDAARIHLVAYHNSAIEDEVTRTLRGRCEQWHLIETLSDAAVATLIQQDEIDILVDLSGYTAGHRQDVFARKPAPVQVSWLGYFSTTGQPTMDYVLADPVCVPDNESTFFVEKIWRLPHIRYCFSPPEQAGDVTALPALANGYITFGSYQTMPKINPNVLACWSAVLKQSPTARLRIQNGQIDTARMRQYFEAQLREADLPLERIDLIGNQSRADYLASYSEVDMVLDTFPYPGGTTTAEALWMGVPTLTYARPGMLGRQGEAMLAAVGLHEWVTRSRDDYIARAIQWANCDASEWQPLAELRAGLRERARASPLFDGPRFARNLEEAFWGMCNAAAQAQ